MIRYILLAFLTLVTFEIHCEDKIKTSTSKKAISYVKSKVKCNNPEYVAKLVFGEYDDDIFSSFLLEYKTIVKQDGNIIYMFSPLGGNGRSGAEYQYYFIKMNDNMVFLFYSEGYCSEIGDIKLNGRYLIYRTWQDNNFVIWKDVWFWYKTKYIKAYIIKNVNDHEININIIWSQNKEKYKRARKTWEHKVQRGDTLYKISKIYETAIDEIVKQNDLKDINKIKTQIILKYDNLKNKKREKK